MMRAARCVLGRLSCSSLCLALLTAAAPAGAEGVAPHLADPQQKQNAQAAYEQGVAHFKEREFSEAAEAFGRSYGIVASPNSHLMFARALREAGRLREAYEELALAQAEAGRLAETAPRYGATAESAEAEMLELRKRVAVLRLRLAGGGPDATIDVGDRTVPRGRWAAVAVEPGAVDVVARRPGGQRDWKQVTAQLGKVVTVDLDLRPPEDRERVGAAQPKAADRGSSTAGVVDVGEQSESESLMPWVWVAGGVGAAGIATFAIAGSMSRSTFSDLDGDCPNKQCPPGREGDIDKGKREQTIANVGLLIGLVGAGAAATFYFIETSREGPRVGVGVGPGSVSLAGAF